MLFRVRNLGNLKATGKFDNLWHFAGGKIAAYGRCQRVHALGHCPAYLKESVVTAADVCP